MMPTRRERGSSEFTGAELWSISGVAVASKDTGEGKERKGSECRYPSSARYFCLHSKLHVINLRTEQG